ncbi:OstA-like protein [Pedobacter cryoconitis]|uniref:OstA-like protein n=1 Tax=Pedobacter cryoconitis TaxID=188932 RepID=UPI00180D220A|nr:OstA-like protein [Pedobacter cryoconitis]MBB5648072.1 lipopolysaccharide export system protein LptA [Pedobacter cryoconitis]
MNSIYSNLTLRIAGILLFFFFPLSLSAQQNAMQTAQQRTKIILQSSERSKIITKTDITYLRKPVFKQDNAILTCDSAVFYTSKNYFEAFNNVHINQADTINIYSDFLTYDGNAKLAHLTSNVRLLDRTSVLTTNVLDYAMAPKVGTYVSGGKIVNKDATITSKNGYYFANSRDAYFRYNVLVVTEQSTIKSDTLRYNTLTNWAYFYGPTNIREKDGGNLYTENGAYNTKTTYAYFGKNNLYTSGSKSLKGDSLYYDGRAGYGKAVRNIVFKDTIDKMLMHGQLGYYYKKDQRTLVTKNAYAGMGTSDSILVKEVKRPDSLWLGADTLETQMVLQKTLKLIKGPVIKKDNELGEESREGSKVGSKKAKPADPKKPGVSVAGNGKNPKAPPIKLVLTAKDSVKRDSMLKAKVPIQKIDSIFRKAAELKALDTLQKKAAIAKIDAVIKNGIPVLSKETLKADSLKSGLKADPTVKKVSPPKPAPAVKITDPALTTDTSKIKTGITKVKTDTAKLKSDGVKIKTDTAKLKTGVKPVIKKTTKDSLPFNPADTVLTRSIKAYHHVNVFKSNMQAKADSLFYTSADSTLRWYKNPIIWSQNSQQTGDTIYLQLRNKKINSVQIISNAFAVNVDPVDSAKFNQIKGKMITGFFKDGALNSMYVDGNAESVYFTKTDDGKKYDKMNQTISSRIKVNFRKNEISDVVPIKDVEGATTPVADIKQDVILTGFIWKPELRPRSKRDITNPKIVAKPKAATKPVVKAGAKPGVKTPGKPATKDLKDAAIDALTDQLPGGAGAIIRKAAKDTDPKILKNAADSLKNKINPLEVIQKVPPKIADTIQKIVPSLLKKADTLSKQPVLLKKQ